MSLKALISFKDESSKATEKIANAISIAVGKSVLVLERNIKRNTPVLTGTLKRSIYSRQINKGEGEVRTASTEGGNEINYAAYVEYGTRSQAPAAMFRKGADQSQDKIAQLFTDALEGVK